MVNEDGLSPTYGRLSNKKKWSSMSKTDLVYLKHMLDAITLKHKQ